MGAVERAPWRAGWCGRARLLLVALTSLMACPAVPGIAAPATPRCPLIVGDGAVAVSALPTGAVQIRSADIVATQSRVTVAVRLANLNENDPAAIFGYGYQFVFSTGGNSYYLSAQTSPFGPYFEAGAWQWNGTTGSGNGLSATQVDGRHRFRAR